MYLYKCYKKLLENIHLCYVVNLLKKKTIHRLYNMLCNAINYITVARKVYSIEVTTMVLRLTVPVIFASSTPIEENQIKIIFIIPL